MAYNQWSHSAYISAIGGQNHFIFSKKYNLEYLFAFVSDTMCVMYVYGGTGRDPLIRVYSALGLIMLVARMFRSV
jgi:hypothetical protein